MAGAAAEYLPVQLALGIGALLSLQDVEVVLDQEAPAVARGPDGGAEDDQVLGDRGVQQEDVAHRATGVVQNPLAFAQDVAGVGHEGAAGRRR
jgi:hypothetical protein